MNQVKGELNPHLRFPKFRDVSGWTKTRLGDVLTEHKLKSDGKSVVHSVSVHKGIVNQIEHLGRSFAASDTSNYNLVMPYDIVYTKSPTGDFPYGVIKQNSNLRKVVVSPLYGVFSPVNRYIGCLIDAYFESSIRTNNYLAPIIQKGAKNTIQISNVTFLSNEISLPTEVKEQQDIAECLLCLNNLITAQFQKLDALKKHKRRLLKQLFPREGETTPSLRFPEFQNTPEWAATKLGDVCLIQRGRFSHRPRNDPQFFGGKYPFIQTGDVVKAGGGTVRGSQSLNERGLLVSKLFKPTIVLITIAANIGDTAILDHEACFTDSVVGLIPNTGVSPYFLELAVRGKKDYLNKIAPQAAQKNINNEILREVEIIKPEYPEQQRIVSCLSSLDDLIVAQSKTFNALKANKQGLMQQLFPLSAQA